MKFENTRVFNFEGAFFGMRNPKESWHLSDSECLFHMVPNFKSDDPMADKYYEWNDLYGFNCKIGPKDMKLAQTLIKAGSEHRKFMRQIFVSVDITAPLYWWKEFDTYKVGTFANSTSTMHKITSKPITIDCFEIDDYNNDLEWTGVPIGDCVSCYDSKTSILRVIDMLEGLRLKYLETKDKRYWKELIRWLPESWLQTRTVTMSYENILAMCGKGQRRFHKLNEWSGIHTPVKESFIQWARTLPYAQELIFIDELNKEEE